MRKFLLIAICLIIGYSTDIYAQSQTIEVTGSVKDASNMPLIGVNISVKNVSGLGVITDIDGNYRIKIAPFNTLIFSYVGFETKEILIKENMKKVDVILKESSESVLDEVVITGTGVQKKVTLTGAISTVDVNLLKTSSSSVTNALAGNVPGIMARQVSGQPGKNTSDFWIRGISTFGANTSALVLVDGFERSLDEINVEDIESFSVLKDASATAIYGSRGANGVVLITTKRGKAGKININAKVESSYNMRTYTPEFVDGATYARMLNESRTTRGLERMYDDNDLYLFQSGMDPDLYPNVDWLDTLLKDGAMTYRANIDISGGGSTARYFVSMSYLNEDGMYKVDKALKDDYDSNASYQRWNYRMNVDVDITKSTLLKVGVSGWLSKQNESGFGEGQIWASAMGQNPITIPIMYSDGKVPAAGQNERANPWMLATQGGYIENWDNTIQTNITLEQKLDFVTKGLKFTGRFGFDTKNTNEKRNRQWPEQWKAERERDSNGNIVYTRVSPSRTMYHEADGNGTRKEFFEAILQYDRKFGYHHVGGTLKYTQDETTNTQNVSGYNWLDRKHQGLAGRFTYGWKYRYFVDFNFGYNGSENFAPGEQFGFFPAYSAAWNIAEETFIKKNLKWINMFKVRYSYGKVGSDYVNNIRFPYLPEFGNKNEASYNWGDYNNGNKYNALTYTSIASRNITWEIATKHDLGVDLSLWNDKLTATVDYFHETRDGIYMKRANLPWIVGMNGLAAAANVGKIRSTGFDGNFAFRQKIGKVDLTARGNFTYSKNKILEYDEVNSIYPYRQQAGRRVDQAVGLVALGLFKDYDDIRNSPDQSALGTQIMPGDIKYKDINSDGVINDNDIVPIGATTRPNLIYGFALSAIWNGFDINAHFQGAGKSSFFIKGQSVHAFSQGEWGNVFQDMVDSGYWSQGTNEDPNAKYPRLSWNGNSNNNRESSYWLRNGSYLRLKTLELGYTVPVNISRALRMNKIRIFFLGTNLLTFTKFKLWDPEMGSSTGQGYPLSKSCTLGLTINI